MYTLMLVALHNSKGPFVLMILHHEPRDRLVIFAVYIASLDELVMQFGDGVGGIFGVEVDYDSVDHIYVGIILVMCLLFLVVKMDV